MQMVMDAERKLGHDPRDALLVPGALLQFFPVPFVFRIDEERSVLNFQDQVGNERTL